MEEGLDRKQGYDDDEEISIQSSTSSMDSSGVDTEELTQFQLDDTSSAAVIL